jgi:hypothetical protein
MLLWISLTANRMNQTGSTLLIPKRAFSNAVGYFTAGEFVKKCVRYFGVELSNGRCAMIATTKLMTLAKGAATAQNLHKSEPSLCGKILKTERVHTYLTLQKTVPLFWILFNVAKLMEYR